MREQAKALYKRLNIPGITYALILVWIFFGFITDWRVATSANLMLICRNASLLILASTGMTMVVLTSQVDLSIGSVMSLTGVVIAVSIRNGWGLPAAIALGLLVGVVIGAINGFLVAYMDFNYWVTTFATMGIAAGLALVFSNGATVQISSSAFKWIGNGKLFGVYFMLYITLIVIVTAMFILKKTKFGYNIYSTGGSELTTKLSGVNVVRNRWLVYICSGFFASVAGMVMAAMNSAGNPIGGTSYSFDSLAAVVIGGTSLSGGRGGLVGTILGALLLRTLSNGLGLLNLPATWQRAIIGIVIVSVLVIDAIGINRRNMRGLMRVYADE